jgi:cation transport protein ChaC
MSLTRADLQNGLLHRLSSECRVGPAPLSHDALAASIQCVLSGARTGDDVWVFAYGSLMWNPLFHYAEHRPATVRGYHRRFCLWSMTGRGTPETPGLVLGLEFGGACHGLAYRLPADKASEELQLLWRREMVVGSYSPRWVRIETAPCADSMGCTEELRALTFVVNRQHPNYAGRLAVETVARTLAAARGHIGSSADYLLHTVAALAQHGLRDAYLEQLHERVTRAAARS